MGAATSLKANETHWSTSAASCAELPSSVELGANDATETQRIVSNVTGVGNHVDWRNHQIK